MSWTDSHPVEPVVYRWRALAAFIAALALVVGVAAPAALPGIVGACLLYTSPSPRDS